MKFLPDIACVDVYGGHGDIQMVGDFLFVPSMADQLGYLYFTRAEHQMASLSCSLRSARRMASAIIAWLPSCFPLITA